MPSLPGSDDPMLYKFDLYTLDYRHMSADQFESHVRKRSY